MMNPKLINVEELIEVIKSFDLDNSGYIELSELKAIYKLAKQTLRYNVRWIND